MDLSSSGGCVFRCPFPIRLSPSQEDANYLAYGILLCLEHLFVHAKVGLPRLLLGLLPCYTSFCSSRILEPSVHLERLLCWAVCMLPYLSGCLVHVTGEGGNSPGELFRLHQLGVLSAHCGVDVIPDC